VGPQEYAFPVFLDKSVLQVFGCLRVLLEVIKYFAEAGYIVLGHAFQVLASHHFLYGITRYVDYGRTDIGEGSIAVVNGDNLRCMLQHQV